MLGRRWRSDECRRRSVSAVRHRIHVGGANLVARRVESALLAPHQPPFHRRSTASASKPAQEPTNDDPSAVTFTRGCSKRYQPCDMARGSMRGSLRPQENLHDVSSLTLLPSAFADPYTRGLHSPYAFSRPSVERSLAGTHGSFSQCEPAQAWEVDMCASKHHFAVGTCMPRLAV